MNEMILKENSLLGEKYYFLSHKSGLEIYIIPKKLSTYYAAFAVKYGSQDNEFEINGSFHKVPNGIAHFLEHKMFESEDGEDTFVRFAKTGANANAFTSFNKTSYLFSCTDNFYESLEILLDFVTHPYFTKENVEKEMGIIGEEIGMMNDNPGWALMFNMLDGLYKNHAVKINIAGSEESISKITPELLYECYDAFYNPSNMALIVCGDVDAQKIVSKVDEKITSERRPCAEKKIPHEEKNSNKPYVEAKMDVATPMFSIGIKDLDISEDAHERLIKSSYITVILETMFGPSSPLFNELYNEGLINGGLGYDFEHNRSFSFIEISAKADDVKKTSERIFDYIEKVKKDGFGEGLFDRAKKVCYSQIIKSFDSTEEIANNVLANVCDGIDFFDADSAMSTVNEETALEIMKKLFKREYSTLSVILPQNKEVS